MAIYDTSYIGTEDNRVYFNDYTNQYQSGVIYRVKSRAPSRRQIRELDIPIPFESGISDFQTLIGQTAYIINGTMYPSGESDSDSGLARLRKVASLDISQDDAFSDMGYVPYCWTEAQRNKQVFLKVLYVQMLENTRTGLVQDFSLICKVKDPTIFSEDVNEANTAEGAFGAATGSAIHSFTFPIVYGSSTNSVSVDANNLGDIPVYPVTIQIHGPVNSPKIINTTTGEYIQTTVNLASTGNTLSISYDKDSLRVELDGVSVLNQVTDASTFWKLQPGSNIISLTGSSISDDAYATVSYYSGWPLS